MKRILFAASECVPFIKTGGLADVCGALPKEFSKEEWDVRVVIPNYSCIPEKYRDCIADAAQYREVNDILFITDLLITDYSSIIYEFSLLRRPMLFYAFDQIMYVSTRDFYEPYEDIVPGRIIKRFDQLMEALEKEEYDTDKIEWFIKKNFAYTDGKSTDRVIDLIVGDDKEIKKYSAASMQGALAAVSNNFGMNGEHVDKRYRDDDRSVVQNRGEAQEKDSESQNNDKYSE